MYRGKQQSGTLTKGRGLLITVAYYGTHTTKSILAVLRRIELRSSRRQRVALPLSYKTLVGVEGIEPSARGPKPRILPLYYTPLVEVMGVEPTAF